MNTKTKSFKLKGPYKSPGTTIYKFKTPDNKNYNIYFSRTTKKLTEILFENTEYKGFDTLIADGYLTEKLNTCADAIKLYEKKNKTHLDGLWYQATSQRFKAYKRFFNQNQDKLDTFKYYKDKYSSKKKYGYAALFKDKEFKLDSNLEDLLF